MRQAVESTVASLQRLGELVIVTRQCPLEIEHRDARPRCPARLDLCVHRLELAHRTPDQYHVRAARCDRQRERATNPISGAGDSDDASGELIGARPKSSKDLGSNITIGCRGAHSAYCMILSGGLEVAVLCTARRPPGDE